MDATFLSDENMHFSIRLCNSPIEQKQRKLKAKNIGILITDHNVDETLAITDRAYMLFEGKILFQGTAEELAENPIVKERYLGRDFILKRKKE